MRGRPRKHAKIHQLEGTFRPGEHDNGADNRPAAGTPRANRELGPIGQELWDCIVAEWPTGVIGLSDSNALMECCECAQHLHNLRSVARTLEAQIELMPQIEKASKLFLQWACRFGLTPADRGKVKIPPGSIEQDKGLKYFG